MIRLTPMLYTKLENVARVEGFPQTLAIVITLINGETHTRYVSEEKIADYAKPDGEAAKEHQRFFLAMEAVGYEMGDNGLPFFPKKPNWEGFKKKHPDVNDYIPKSREEAMAAEVANLMFEFRQQEKR